jgi:hypothetical protein
MTRRRKEGLSVKLGCRACAQGRYWTRDHYAGLGELASPLSPIERDLSTAIATVWALYESTFRDVCVMEWTLDEATMELTARLQVISLG